MPAMKMVKCFFTAEMPKEVYEDIVDCLYDDYGHYWVDTIANLGPTDQWFVDNGAERGERIFLERGSIEDD